MVVLGGRAELESTASVDGDVFVLGGDIHAQPGSRVTGRSVAYPTAPGALLVLAEGPALGLSPWSRVVVGTKLALLAAWLVTVMALVGAAWPAIESTATAIAEAPLRSFSTGLVAVLAMLLLALFLSAFLGVAAGVPLLVLLGLASLVLKLWGTVAVCALLGRGVARVAGWRGSGPLAQALYGLALLGALKFVPWVGVWAWTAATLVGVGASLLDQARPSRTLDRIDSSLEDAPSSAPEHSCGANGKDHSLSSLDRPGSLPYSALAHRARMPQPLSTSALS